MSCIFLFLTILAQLSYLVKSDLIFNLFNNSVFGLPVKSSVLHSFAFPDNFPEDCAFSASFTASLVFDQFESLT